MSSPNPYPPPGAGGDPSSGFPVANPSAREAYEERRRLTEGVAYVYVPTLPGGPTVGNGPRQVQFELRQLSDGTAGLPVFTEPELLVAQLGEFQPWEKVAVLELLIQVSAAKTSVVINPVVKRDVDRWTAAGLEAWRRENQ